MTQELSDIPLKRIDGAADTLGAHRGNVLLVVNVASRCGLTPQYAALEAIYRARVADGLEVLGFPANNFKAQEPGTDAEIASFCSTTYDVTFPMFAKISVRGDDIHPLYAALTRAMPAASGDGPMRERLASRGMDTGAPGDILWNFEKFVIGRDGGVVARFAPDVPPDDPRVAAAVDRALTA